MEKLTFMTKQLNTAHIELRKVKRFHKQSSKHFKAFYESMSTSLKLLTTGDIYNDIHYVNIINMSTIEHFTKHVSLF
jgi:phosphodiesterase/alkaline phosphatase D-like protein